MITSSMIVKEYLQYLDKTKPTNVGIFLLNATEKDTKYWILMYPFKDVMYYHDIKLTMPFYNNDHSLNRIKEFDSVLLFEYESTNDNTYITYREDNNQSQSAFVITYHINKKDLGNLIEFILPINLQYNVNTDKLLIIA